MAIIELKQVTKFFPKGIKALTDVSLSVEKGSFLLLTGKNGSGKTVLVRHMNGLYKPSSGSVLFEGQNIFTDINYVRRKVGLVFQNSDAQIVGQTVRRDIAFGPENLNLPEPEIRRQVELALKITGLESLQDRQSSLLSGGEKKRLSIAGVLAMDPEVIILDEPFSNLDYPGVKQVLHCLDHLHQKGKTIICVTHELEKVLAHGDTLIIMDQGEVAACGRPAELLSILRQYGVHIPKGLSLKQLTWLD